MLLFEGRCLGAEAAWESVSMPAPAAVPILLVCRLGVRSRYYVCAAQVVHHLVPFLQLLTTVTWHLRNVKGFYTHTRRCQTETMWA